PPPLGAGADEEPEHDLAQVVAARVLDGAVAAGLLAHLAARGLGLGLARGGVPLGQLPARPPARGDEAHFHRSVGPSPETSAGAALGSLPQAAIILQAGARRSEAPEPHDARDAPVGATGNSGMGRPGGAGDRPMTRDL